MSPPTPPAPPAPTRPTHIACLAGLLLALSGCAKTPALQPFATDGCSMFPDRALIGKADWCTCCVAHDLAYWQGGTETQRLEADRELERCVTGSTRNPELGKTMFAGVRAGGLPYFPTWYRWGYGWTYGRGYQPLSASEQAQAASLRAAYVGAGAPRACAAPGP